MKRIDYRRQLDLMKEKELIHFYSTYEAFTGLYCLNIRDNCKI